MTEQRGETHVIIGLPRSGKSTFLAALWYVAGREPRPGELRVKPIGASTSYIEDLCDLWSTVTELIKTRIDEDARISLSVFDPALGQSATITFPDISGEAFRGGFTDRSWPRSMADDIAGAASIVLFVHPDVGQPESLAKANRAFRAIDAVIAEEGFTSSLLSNPKGDAQQAGTKDGDDSSTSAQEFVPAKCPHDVMLVDLLQSALRLNDVQQHISLVLVISAWDLVQDNHPSMSPSAWLESRLPLLRQFLKSNEERVRLKLFGISAQGGPATDVNERERLLEYSDPRERILVTDGSHTDHDISRVLRTVLKWNV